MKKNVKYTDEPLGRLRVVRDFLPPPDQLAFKQKTVKVTIALSKSSIDFFKKAARKHHAPYQTMIRTLIDTYAANYRSA